MRDYWNAQAASFDEAPDHGLLDPGVRTAWADLLLPLLPAPPAEVADLGCGTGTLSVLLAQAGHRVRGMDFADQMVAAASRKAAGLSADFTCEFSQGDVTQPGYPPASFDVILARHVLWALADPAKALATWVTLLKPGGALVLIEGRWSTGAGLTAAQCQGLVRSVRQEADIQRLDDPRLWGGPIEDERYLLFSPT